METELGWALAGRALAVWGGILVLAVASGGVRELALAPRLGHAWALALGGIWLCLVIVAVTYAAAPWLDARQGSSLLAVGLGWLGLTVAFETLFGLLRGQTVAELLAAYTLRGGNLWPLVLLTLAAAPWLAAWLRGWR